LKKKDKYINILLQGYSGDHIMSYIYILNPNILLFYLKEQASVWALKYYNKSLNH